MVEAFTKRYCEDSKGWQLQFKFYCDLCHREYAAPAVEIPGKRGLFQRWKWKKAYRTSFEEAQKDAKEHFNRCVKCKRWVCDEDFSPDFGLCVECDRGNRA